MLSLIDGHALYQNILLDYASSKLFLLPHNVERNDQTESFLNANTGIKYYFHFMVITLAVK